MLRASGEARMRSLFASMVLCAFCVTGCLKHEVMTQEEVLKYNPRPEEFTKSQTGVQVPKPETCIEAGRMYEALYKAEQEPLKKRDFAWRAKKAYQQAAHLQPQMTTALAGQARMEELEGNNNATGKFYSQCLSQIDGKQPGDAAVLYEAGMYYARQKQFDPAVQCLTQAMRMEPSNRTFAMNYGFTLARAGRFEESYRHFCQITAPADAGYQVALMAKHVGNVEMARQYGMMSVQANPQKSQEAQAFLASLDQAATPQTAVQQTQGAAGEQAAVPEQ
jgi:tetratricopeptide (TPR) repeat protein